MTDVHAEIIQWGLDVQPFSILAGEALVHEVKDPVDVIFMAIRKTIVHIEDEEEVTLRMVERSGLVVTPDETLFFEPWSHCVFPSNRSTSFAIDWSRLLVVLPLTGQWVLHLEILA